MILSPGSASKYQIFSNQKCKSSWENSWNIQQLLIILDPNQIWSKNFIKEQQQTQLTSFSEAELLLTARSCCCVQIKTVSLPHTCLSGAITWKHEVYRIRAQKYTTGVQSLRAAASRRETGRLSIHFKNRLVTFVWLFLFPTITRLISTNQRDETKT